MMDEIQGNDAIESKAIKYTVPEDGTAVPMILTAFEEEDNQPLDDAGYRGRYVMFSLIDGGVQDCFTDPYSSTHHVVGGEVLDFILEVRRGWKTYGDNGIDWTEIEHGGVYDRADFDVGR